MSNKLLDFEIPEAIEDEKSEPRKIQSKSGGAIDYAFVGSGQGGSRLAESFYQYGYEKCIVLNTAKHDLENIEIPDDQKLLMKLDGLDGAGKDMARGAKAAKKYEQDFYDMMKIIFGRCDRIIVCVGAGGGTGGGSLFTLLTTIRRYLQNLGVERVDSKIGVICSIPEDDECVSSKVASNALDLIIPLCDYAEEGKISPLLFVDNNKIRKLYPNLTVNDYWPTVNKSIAGLFNVFNVMATKSSTYVSFDSADYDKIMSAHGCLIMGATKVKNYNDPNSIGISIKSNLERTLLAEGFDLSSAKAVGSIVIGGDILFNSIGGLYDSISNGFNTLGSITGNSEVYRGIYQEPGNTIMIYNIITGLQRPIQRLESLSRFVKNNPHNFYGETK